MSKRIDYRSPMSLVGVEPPRRRYSQVRRSPRRWAISTTIASLTFALASAPALAFPYTVRSGDTLYLLSQRYGVPLAQLQAANSNWSGYLEVGQQITIPDGTSLPNPNPPTSPANGGTQRYTVQPGDTLYLVAQRYGLSFEEVQRLNGWQQTLYPGQVILLPTGNRGPANNGSGGGGGRYTVQYGDTLYLIAQRYGVSVGQLRQANGIWSDTLYPGQAIIIPSGVGSTPPSNPGDPTAPGPSTPPTPAPGSPPPAKLQISWNDQMLLAQLVRAEAEGEPLAGQVAVAATVLNRLQDPRFPRSVPGIIYQVVDGYYQYSPVQNGRINLPPTSASQQAVTLALQGWDPSGGANGFYRPSGVSLGNWVRQQPVTAVIGNHVFFRS